MRQLEGDAQPTRRDGAPLKVRRHLKSSQEQSGSESIGGAHYCQLDEGHQFGARHFRMTTSAMRTPSSCAASFGIR